MLEEMFEGVQPKTFECIYMNFIETARKDF